MAVIRLVALKYFSPQLPAGGVYETTDPKAAEMLIAAGLMRPADHVAPAAPASDSAAGGDDRQTVAPRRSSTYRSRQMTAAPDA